METVILIILAVAIFVFVGYFGAKSAWIRGPEKEKNDDNGSVD